MMENQRKVASLDSITGFKKGDVPIPLNLGHTILKPDSSQYKFEK